MGRILKMENPNHDLLPFPLCSGAVLALDSMYRAGENGAHSFHLCGGVIFALDAGG
jgi:hypothetical protein